MADDARSRGHLAAAAANDSRAEEARQYAQILRTAIAQNP
jgi:hypothetical protein